VVTQTGIDDVLAAAAAARRAVPPPGDPRYDAYCGELADRLRKDWEQVLAVNAADLAAARDRGLGDTLLDRLALSGRHLDQMVALAEDVRRRLPGIVGEPQQRALASGGTARRIAKPLGTVLMIYEARPTVTVEGALLPVVVGNAVILRGGAEIAATNVALGAIAADAAAAAGLPDGIVQVLADGDRRLVRELLRRSDGIDVLIPRGSPSLIDYCRSASRIPVIASGGGANHLYVDAGADLELAARIAVDSKLSEPTACNTLELVLAHRDVAAAFTRALLALTDRLPEPCVLRLDPALAGPYEGRTGRTGIAALTGDDDGREFLDRSIGVRAVAGPEEAIAHISWYGSGHTEAIAATDPAVVGQFLDSVDAAALVVNGSLRLHDGPTMGLGPELSISTGRLHVRGPVGPAALLTYSWVIDGAGALRGTTGAGE
jgi:glutamate-5-semialdehyde dehydrogenase